MTKKNQSALPVPSVYEKQAIAAIHGWKNPKLTWWDQALKVINTPIEFVGDLAMEVPGVDFVIDKSFGGVLRLLNSGAAYSVRPTAIFKEFSPPVTALEGIHGLPLKRVDHAIGFLAAKYEGMAAVEGAAAGGASTLNPAAAIAAIPADIAALLTMNLRAIGEYASYCGFDISHQEERLFALNVLGLASSPTDASKQVALAQLVKIATEVAKKRTWRQLEEHLFVQIVQRISKALAIRLTKAKLAQVVPVAGIVIGGGFNAYFTGRVCDAANNLYRERFLARKYGPDIIEVTVNPASATDFASGYEDK